jgi:hypothetical protein
VLHVLTLAGAVLALQAHCGRIGQLGFQSPSGIGSRLSGLLLLSSLLLCNKLTRFRSPIWCWYELKLSIMLAAGFDRAGWVALQSTNTSCRCGSAHQQS